MENPFFLFLGQSDHDGVTARLKATRTQYVKKILDSALKNWASIFALLENRHLKGVIVKLNVSTVSRMAEPEFRDSSVALIRALGNVPHIIFVHDSYYKDRSAEGEFPDDRPVGFNVTEFIEEPGEPNAGFLFGQYHRGAAIFLDKVFDEFEINVVPYERNAELTLIASEFIEQHERNLIFRLYVPNGRMWASESDRVLALFREHLVKVSGLKVTQNQQITPNGVYYEFSANEPISGSKIADEFNEFSKVVDLSLSSPEVAMAMLSAKSIQPAEISQIIEKYAKEARRLHVDLKHDRERRLLSIRHRLEAELMEFTDKPLDWEAVNILIDSQVPRVSGVSSALGFGGPPAEGQTQHLTLNINPQIIQHAQGIIAQEVSGTQNLGFEPAQILELIKDYGGSRAPELTSAVYELEDENSATPSRMSAAGKLKSFLYAASGKVTGVALAVLQSYIEKKLGL